MTTCTIWLGRAEEAGWIPAGERARALGRQPPLESLGSERPRLRDQRSRVIDLPPGVPQQDAAHAPVLEVVDHTVPKWRLPVRHRFQPRVQVPDRLIAELEQIRVEKGEVNVGRRAPRHVLPGDL